MILERGFGPALLLQDLKIRQIHIDCYRPHDEMNRDYDAQITLAPEQNSFKSVEWTVHDSGLVVLWSDTDAVQRCTIA